MTSAERAVTKAYQLAFERYPGTAGDRSAIELVAGWFREAGLEVEIEPFSYDVEPAFQAIRLVLITAAGAIAASGFLVDERPFVAALILVLGAAVGVTLLSWSPWAEKIYSRPGPTETANVVGRRPGRDPRATVVFLAHHDSKSQNLTFPVRMGLTILALAGGLTLAGSVAATLADVAMETWVAPGAGLVTAAALLILSRLRSGNRSPGGVDNAGSVGILCELASLLPERMPDDVELVFLSPGAEEDHMVGAMRWLDAHAEELSARPVWAVNFDGAGAPGRLVLITRFGFGRRFAPRLAEIAQGCAAELGLPVRRILMLPAIGIDSIPFAHRGIECLTIASGSLDRATIAIHSKNDRPEHLDNETVERALRLAVALADELAKNPPNP